MSREVLEALMHAEYLTEIKPANADEVHARAWAIVYLLQRAWRPDFAPENYQEVICEALAYNGTPMTGGVH